MKNLDMRSFYVILREAEMRLEDLTASKTGQYNTTPSKRIKELEEAIDAAKKALSGLNAGILGNIDDYIPVEEQPNGQ